MQTYLEELDLWEVMEEDDGPFLENPTVTQIKMHRQKKTRKTKVKSYLLLGISQMIIIKIISLKPPKQIWDYMKEKYKRNENIQDMNILDLIWEFEM